jgi:oxygen-independent coproporphyrinogen-3 oxidase
MTISLLPESDPYIAYTYAYPHKTAYRALDPPVPLADLWAGEDRRALFLYMHVPFCEMRCGFCNLFTTVNPKGGLEAAYLAALERQARQVRAALGAATVARFAIGGGTPTYLHPAELDRLFGIATELYGLDLARTPISVETSPHTATPDRLALLRARSVDRISIGVQSFIEVEAHAAGRPQRTAEVLAALTAIRHAGFPTLNIDLIYGLPGQTVASWRESLQMALRFAPEELYLYPLYNRPLTGLNRTGQHWEDLRLECYRAGRDMLLEAGYTQVSMRMFRAAHTPNADGPAYCCQEDGMVGLGCGARSYTHALHYSSEYAVGSQGVRAILADYVARPDADFAVAAYGHRLAPDDQRRRYVIQSLGPAEGLSFAEYRARFGGDALADLPQLAELPALGLAAQTADRLALTPAGMERADAIGPWLYSDRVQALMEAYELR